VGRPAFLPPGEVAQVGDEPGDLEGFLVEVDPVERGDPVEDRGERLGPLNHPGQVRGVELGVDEVQRLTKCSGSANLLVGCVQTPEGPDLCPSCDAP
jgi:hypothetical protein